MSGRVQTVRAAVGSLAVALCAVALCGQASAAQARAVLAPHADHPTGGFDQYGGSMAVQLARTGWFRTTLLGGRWWLVDPDGHPFFSEGVDTVTSYGGLPDANGNFQYANTVQGLYGSPQSWAAAQLIRFHDWGVNTIGAWSEPDLSLFADQIPYTPIIPIIGAATVTNGLPIPTGLTTSLGENANGELQDFFAPSWSSMVDSRIWTATHGLENDPYLLGYYTDSELPWLQDAAGRTPLDVYLAMPADAPGKHALVDFLRLRYHGSFTALKADFPTLTATSWVELYQPDQPVGLVRSAGASATMFAWTGVVAKRYFAVTARALHMSDPHHLNLGVKFIAGLTPLSVIDAAARYVDVMSVDFYEGSPGANAQEVALRTIFPEIASTAGMLDQFSQSGRKPVLISEFGYRAADSGLPNSIPQGFVTVPTQQARGEATSNYVQCALNTPYIVGTHWFEMTDDPAAGRIGDGENSNFGLLSVGDTPYTPVTDALAGVHTEAYQRLTNPESLPCVPVGPQ
jgi:hypothetical protein